VQVFRPAKKETKGIRRKAKGKRQRGKWANALNEMNESNEMNEKC